MRARWGEVISALPLALHHVAGSNNLADATTCPPFAAAATSLLVSNPLRAAPSWGRVVAIDDEVRSQLVRDKLRVRAFKERELALAPSVATVAVFPLVAAVTVSPHHSTLAALLPPGTTLVDLQLANLTLRPIIDFVRARRPAGGLNCAALERSARDLWWDSATGLSYVLPLANPRFLHATQVVPVALQRSLVIRIYSDASLGAHCGELCTAELTRSAYHIEALARVVHDVCSVCPCQFSKHVRQRRTRALHTVRSGHRHHPASTRRARCVRRLLHQGHPTVLRTPRRARQRNSSRDGLHLGCLPGGADATRRLCGGCGFGVPL